MSSFNMTCAICTDEFRNSQLIESTYCGHIFHKGCLDSRALTSNSCPICRYTFGNPRSHPLYIDINDQESNSEKFEELNAKLKSAEERNQELKDQKKELEGNFGRLQKQLIDSIKSKEELEQQIREPNYTEDDFLDLQHEFTESEKTTNHLRQVIQELSSEIERKTNEINLKNEVSLRTHSSASDTGSSNSSGIKSRINLMEQKLKYLSEELEKEILSSTQLSIENMKLESYIQTSKNNDPKPIKSFSSNNGETDNILIIENFPKSHLRYPLKNIIIDLAARIMVLPICQEEDVCDVKMFDKNEYEPNSIECVALYVKFRNRDIKTNFILRQDVMKSNPFTSYYTFKENVDDNFLLFLYAKDKLQNNGFVQVLWKNNRVFTKKHENSTPFQVHNRRHVNNLLKRHIEVLKSLAAKI